MLKMWHIGADGVTGPYTLYRTDDVRACCVLMVSPHCIQFILDETGIIRPKGDGRSGHMPLLRE